MTTKHDRPPIHSALAAMALSAISVAALLAGSQQNSASAQGAPKLEDSVVFAMPGGPATDIMKKCTEDYFTKQFNTRVDILSIQTEPALARILAQRNNPTIDVTWSLAQTDHTGFKEGVFIPLAPALIPNLANVDPKFSAEPNRGPLIASAIQGIQYNTKIFQEKGWAPPTSWRDLWDPKYKGHVGITGLGLATGPGLLAVAGALSGKPSQNFDAGFEYLPSIKPNLYTIFQQGPPHDTAILNGTVWLGIAPSGRPLALMQQGAPIAFVQPSEGVVTATISLSIVKGAPHPNAALAFVNWMLGKEAQACLMRSGYAPVAKGVDIPSNLLPFMTVQRNVIPLDWVSFQEKLPELLKRWSKEMEG